MPAPVRELPVRGEGIREERGIGRPVYPQDVRPDNLGDNLLRLTADLDPHGEGHAAKFYAEQQQLLRESIATNEALGRPLDELAPGQRILFGGAVLQEETDKIRAATAADRVWERRSVELLNSDKANALPSEQREFLTQGFLNDPIVPSLSEAGQTAYAERMQKHVLGAENAILGRYAEGVRKNWVAGVSDHLKAQTESILANPGGLDPASLGSAFTDAFTTSKVLLMNQGLAEDEAEKVLMDSVGEIVLTKEKGQFKFDGTILRNLLDDPNLIRTPAIRETIMGMAAQADSRHEQALTESRKADEQGWQIAVDKAIGEGMAEAEKSGDISAVATMSFDGLPFEYRLKAEKKRDQAVTAFQSRRDGMSEDRLKMLESQFLRGEKDRSDPEYLEAGPEERKRLGAAADLAKKGVAAKRKNGDVILWFDVLEGMMLPNNTRNNRSQNARIRVRLNAAEKSFADRALETDNPGILAREVIEPHLLAMGVTPEQIDAVAEMGGLPESPNVPGTTVPRYLARPPGQENEPVPSPQSPVDLTRPPEGPTPAMSITFGAPTGEGGELGTRAGAALAGIQSEQALRAGGPTKAQKGQEVGLARKAEAEAREAARKARARRAQEQGITAGRDIHAEEAWAVPPEAP